MFNFQSRDLETTLRSAYSGRLTGYISVTQQQDGRNTYGTIALVEGQVIAAQFANQRGLTAFTTLTTLANPIISLARSGVQLERDADMPSMQAILGAADKNVPSVPAKQVNIEKKATTGTANKSAANFGIFPRVLLTMFLVALIPLAGFWYISNIRAKAQLEADAIAKVSSAAQTLTEDVNTWVDNNVLLLRNTAELPGFTALPTQTQTALLETVNRTYPWIADMSLTNAVGQATAGSDIVSLQEGVPSPIYDEAGNLLWNLGEREYFKQVLSGQPVGQQTVIDMTNGTAQVCLAVPAKTAGQFQGSVVGCSNLDNISKAVTSVSIGQTGYALMVDDNGQLIAHGQVEALEESEILDYRQHPVLINGKTGETIIFEQNGKKMVGLAQKTSLGWTLIVEQEYNDAFATVLESQRNAFILLGVTVVLVILVAFLLARWLAQPIQSLTAAAENISRGQLQVDVGGTERKDEIGALARAVDRMGVSLKMAMSELQDQAKA